MVISFADEKLERICSVEREALRRLGKPGARQLRARLADMVSVARVTELVAGHPHPLKGDREGEFSVNLDGGRRLTFRPSASPVPRLEGGAVNWQEVTAVEVVFIGDYHD
jgi:proteic killer suppression protein